MSAGSDVKDRAEAPITRRKFLKAAAVLTSVATGACGRSRPTIYSHVKEPDYTPGTSVWYSSVCRECSAGCGTIVRTRDGRPNKLEGNPDHPISRGGLCAKGQASIIRQYAEGRISGPLVGGKSASWEEALAAIESRLKSGPGKIAILTGVEENLTNEAIEIFRKKFGAEKFVLDTYAYSAEQSAFGALYGRTEAPHFDLGGVDCIVSFGADILGSHLSPMEFSRAYGNLRDLGGSYFYVGSRSNLSADAADRFYVVEPGREEYVAAGVLHELALRKKSPLAALGIPIAEAAQKSGIPEKDIMIIAEKLSNKAQPFVFGADEALGNSATARYAFLINSLLGGSSRYRGRYAVSQTDSPERIAELSRMIKANEIGTLIVRGVDPAIMASLFPADALTKIGMLVVAADRLNATTPFAHVVLADETPFESWGVYPTTSEVESLLQPTIRPQVDSRSFSVVIAALAGETFDPLARIKASWTEADMKAGFRIGAKSAPLGAPKTSAIPASTPIEGPTLIAYPSLLLGDPSREFNSILQEVPDPVTQNFWQTTAEFGAECAAEHGVTEGDIVELKTESGSIRLQARVHDAGRASKRGIAVSIGRTGKKRQSSSDNPLDLLTAAELAAGMKCVPVAVSRVSAGTLAFPFGSLDQGDRNIAREMREDGGGQAQHEIDPSIRLYNESRYAELRWGMTIDLDKCTGCSACVAACYVENNIPVVGPALMGYGREMSWLTIQRYRTDHGVVSLPMLCQQCGQAPCEPVCPVYATYHNSEGLNVQVYNRCIGTRYCANNCPYKVRRFNFFQYHPATQNGGLNPEVSARGVGVMEKCTFCVQRIRAGEHTAKREKRNLRDGDVKSACQESCPTRAITFGNAMDENSELSRTRQRGGEEGRGYKVLDLIGTQPAVTYLERKRTV